MKILVCSLSHLKRDAVLEAATRLGLPDLPDILPRETSSGHRASPNQPLGDDQTLLGALQRAGNGWSGYYVVGSQGTTW